jgi:arylformamidase
VAAKYFSRAPNVEDDRDAERDCRRGIDLNRGERSAPGGLEEEEVSPQLNDLRESGPFALPAGARVTRDIAYGNDPLQRLDVYQPAKANLAPVFIMAHGGGWVRGNKRLWRVVKNKVTHWVAKGYVFVSTNYRLVPAVDPLQQADDLAKALAFVQSNLRAWGGDPARVVLMGHSTGGHLTALLTADPAISQRQGAAPWLASIALDSGAMNIEQIMHANHYALYDAAFGSDPAFWRQASPTLRLKGKPMAPMLVVCSMRRDDSYPQGQAFAAKANSYGGRVEVLKENLTHAEVNDFLGAPGAYTAAVEAFLQSVGVT